MEEGFKIPSLEIKPLIKTKKLPEDDTFKDENNSKCLEVSQKEISGTDNKNSLAECPYKAPKWSAKPKSTEIYYFEVLKQGIIIEKIDNLQSKDFWIFGRLPQCNINLAHPTISRFHAVLQYRSEITSDNTGSEDNGNNSNSGEKNIEAGWYIYDLNSTHGTFLNKMQVPPKTYVRVRVGHMIKLGASTRQFILQGPDTDEEPESELTVTELKTLKKRQEAEFLEQLEKDRLEKERLLKLKEEEGITWGMAEDADEESDLSVNPFASTNNEELFLEDPKKTLRGFFEREGLNLEYNVEEMSLGTFVCRVDLPIDDANGRPIVAEVCHKGKKKDSVWQCALEACRILDRQGVLRQANHEPLKRKITHSDSDDDDDFWDRTGDVERRKLRKACSSKNSAFNYQELLEQEKELLTKMETISNEIDKYQSSKKITKEVKSENDDDLDEFMMSLTDEKKLDKSEIRKLRVEQQRLKAEHVKLQKLIKIAAPIDLPLLKVQQSMDTPDIDNSSDNRKKQALPLFGKRKIVKTNLSIKQKDEQLLSNKTSEIEMEENELSDEEKINENQNDHKENKLKNSSVPSTSSSNERVIVPKVNDENNIRNAGSVKSDTSLRVDDTKSEDVNDKEEVDKVVSKKRKSRIRIRDKNRENVDMDDADEMVDTEKYSEWLPPQDQKGDGFTALNEKLGY